MLAARFDSARSHTRIAAGVSLLVAASACGGAELLAPPPNSSSRFAPNGPSLVINGATVTDLNSPGSLAIVYRVTFVSTSGRVVGEGGSPHNFNHHAFRLSTSGSFDDMGALTNGTNLSYGYGINSAGEVVGTSTDDNAVTSPPMHAFRAITPWDQAFKPQPNGCTGNTGANCGMIDLGASTPNQASAAYAINDGGAVAGEIGGQAVIWSATNTITWVGTLGGSFSTARVINKYGAIAGWSTRADGATHAFARSAEGKLLDLGTLGGTTSQAFAGNDNAQFVGASTRADGSSHAFVWSLRGGMVDLGTLGGTSSAATAINNNGQIVGWSTLADGSQHAFLWTPGSGMEDITPATGFTNPVGLSDGLVTAENAKLAKIDYSLH